MATTLLALDNISLRVGARELLRGVDLAVAEGELHVLPGANGAGKSTLAYLLMGCASYTPQSGEIRFAGEHLKVLGTGCANCKTTLKLIDDVAAEKGVAVEYDHP